MKKRGGKLWIVMAVLLFGLFLAGCGKKYEEASVTTAAVPGETEAEPSRQEVVLETEGKKESEAETEPEERVEVDGKSRAI